MKLDRNAKTCPRGRRLLVERIEEGWPRAQAATAAGSERTAAKWLARWRTEGEAGLADRSSAPHRIPYRTPETPTPARPGAVGARQQTPPLSRTSRSTGRGREPVEFVRFIRSDRKLRLLNRDHDARDRHLRVRHRHPRISRCRPPRAACACCARGRSSQRPASRSGADESIARAPRRAHCRRDPGDGRPRAPRACRDHGGRAREDPANTRDDRDDSLRTPSLRRRTRV
jgi:hypothetical protein